MINIFGAGGPFLVLPLCQGLLGRAFDGIACHKGEATGRGRAAGTGGIGIVALQLDLRGIELQHFRRNLNHGGMRSLSHIGPDTADHGTLNLPRAIQFHPSRG